MALDTGAVSLPGRRVQLEVTTSDAGIAADVLCLTNDPAFQPSGLGMAPTGGLSTPTGLRQLEFTLADADRFAFSIAQLKFAWAPASAPQGVTRYQVYRGDRPDFPVGPEHLLGSTTEPVYYDFDLASGARLYYRVQAMDAWGNLSAASPALAVQAQAPTVRPDFAFHRQHDESSLDTYLQFDARKTAAATGAVRRWLWDFGDGTTGAGEQVSHRYVQPGLYQVTLRVETDLGAGGRLDKKVQVNPVWVEKARGGGGLWLEAEEHCREGGGASRLLKGRVNASGPVVSYWEKDLGHWLEWEIQVETAGSYAIALRYATASDMSLRDCLINGMAPSADWEKLKFPGTGGYSSQTDNWSWRLLQGKDQSLLTCELAAGVNTLKMVNRGGGMALDAILLVPSAMLKTVP